MVAVDIVNVLTVMISVSVIIVLAIQSRHNHQLSRVVSGLVWQLALLALIPWLPNYNYAILGGIISAWGLVVLNQLQFVFFPLAPTRKSFGFHSLLVLMSVFFVFLSKQIPYWIFKINILSNSKRLLLSCSCCMAALSMTLLLVFLIEVSQDSFKRIRGDIGPMGRFIPTFFIFTSLALGFLIVNIIFEFPDITQNWIVFGFILSLVFCCSFFIFSSARALPASSLYTPLIDASNYVHSAFNESFKAHIVSEVVQEVTKVLSRQNESLKFQGLVGSNSSFSVLDHSISSLLETFIEFSNSAVRFESSNVLIQVVHVDESEPFVFIMDNLNIDKLKLVSIVSGIRMQLAGSTMWILVFLKKSNLEIEEVVWELSWHSEQDKILHYFSETSYETMLDRIDSVFAQKVKSILPQLNEELDFLVSLGFKQFNFEFQIARTHAEYVLYCSLIPFNHGKKPKPNVSELLNSFLEFLNRLCRDIDLEMGRKVNISPSMESERKSTADVTKEQKLHGMVVTEHVSGICSASPERIELTSERSWSYDSQSNDPCVGKTRDSDGSLDSSESKEMSSFGSQVQKADMKLVLSEHESKDSGLGPIYERHSAHFTDVSKFETNPMGVSSDEDKDFSESLYEDDRTLSASDLRRTSSMSQLSATLDPTTSPAEKAGVQKSKKDAVIAEILQTEISYIDKLRLLIEFYCNPLCELAKNGLLSKKIKHSDIKDLFSGIQIVMKFHDSFVEQLQQQASSAQIGRIFKNAGPFMKVYKQYVETYEDRIEKLRELKKVSEFSKFLKVAAVSSAEDLSSLMIAPVQRLPRYVLLLKELYKRTDDSDDDKVLISEAIHVLSQITQDVNEAKRLMESTERMMILQSKFDGSFQDLIRPHRRLTREIDVHYKMHASKNLREGRIFLFNDMILWTNLKLKYKSHFMLETVSVSKKTSSSPTKKKSGRISMFSSTCPEKSPLESAFGLEIMDSSSSTGMDVFFELEPIRDQWLAEIKSLSDSMKEQISKRKRLLTPD